ncbi:MAG TPA: riboflavin kinase [Kiritimatiellia bacterium]|nr:riboflavin kinase [Kiritimatiellia bacterium]
MLHDRRSLDLAGGGPFAAALDQAAAMGGTAWVLTFDPHPMKILRPREAPLSLTSTPHKIRLLHELGIEGCLVLAFTPELAALDPGPFLARLTGAWPGARQLVVGSNWTFGHRGRGNADLLRKWVAAQGLQATIVEPVLWDGLAISSTRIRRAVQEGRLDDAAVMLGRPYSLLGTVMAGRRVGTRLGFPTANLDPHNEALPPPGVYAVRAEMKDGAWTGAAFLDSKPHEGLPAGVNLVEVHLLDFSGGELYGRDMEIRFGRRLREVRRFDSLESLRVQIALDVEQVRAEAAGGPGP